MASDISVSSAMACAMDEVNKSGIISHFMKVTGKKTGPMVEAGLFTLTEMFMRENGKTTKLMVKEYTLKTMALAIQANGSKTFSMDSVLNAGPMDLHMKGIYLLIQITL